MSDQISQQDAEHRLWKAIDDERTGMLGGVGDPHEHMQPMTGFAEPDTRTVWFYAKRDSDLARGAEGVRTAMFCLMSKHLWACLGGRLSARHDPARIAQFWNPVVAAWFPEGKDDPDLTLLRLEVADAQVWISQKGPIRFAYEIAKANASKSEPDVGSSTRLNFH